MDFLDDISNVAGATAPKKAILLLHGYGSNGQDMLDMAQQLSPLFPDVVFVAPNAPDEVGPGAYIWYELPADMGGLTQENLCRQLKDVCVKKSLYISKLIENIKAKYSLENNQIGLWGFSQGGLLALVSGLTIQPTISCVIASSSIPLLEAGDWIRSQPPCLLTHGREDEVVPPVAMSLTQHVLQHAHVPVATCLSNNLSHGIDDICQQAAIRFLKDLWQK